MKTGDPFVNPGRIFLKNDKLLVPEEELEDSLEILDSNSYIKLMRTIGGGFSPYQITTFGFEIYANAAVPNYQGKIAEVVSAIVNEKLTSNAEIQERLKENKVIVDHILSVLEDNGHIKQGKTLGGLSYIFNVSPSLRRALRGG